MYTQKEKSNKQMSKKTMEKSSFCFQEGANEGQLLTLPVQHRFFSVVAVHELSLGVPFVIVRSILIICYSKLLSSCSEPRDRRQT